eukprot:632612-Pelagomonas_calceolata.AAC.3
MKKHGPIGPICNVTPNAGSLIPCEECVSATDDSRIRSSDGAPMVWCCPCGLPHGKTPRVANNHATKGHAAPQHVPNWAALSSGLAAEQCWLGCSTQGMSGSRPACIR